MDREPDIIFPSDHAHYATAFWIVENIMEVNYPDGVRKHIERGSIHVNRVSLPTMTAILNFINHETEDEYSNRCQDAIRQYILKRDFDNALMME